MSKKWNLENKEHMLRLRREWYARNKEHERQKVYERREELREWYREYKCTLTCTRCPEKHPACLDFHHSDDTTKIENISVMVHDGWSKARILAEIEGCIVLCSNCHRKEHWMN